jgi:hypothetical protein
VPKVFSEAGKNSAVSFAETGDEFERARYRLAQAIAGTGKTRKPRRAGK